ncbi:MAG: phosphoenolpyruvate--protein phosphotransferase [Clostridium sp.]|nr:phosphoenolpyruvate--protein phosphotransferase [Lachnospiraceae bacterium]OKZ61698.1 MAG: phosphoenolpyruvate--protein phosphotransferase [Clostridium sp. 42_12]
MEQYQGKSVFGGVAIGRIHVFSKGQQQVKRIKVQDTEAEKKRYREAVQTAITELQGLYDKALKEVGEANAAIFEMHQMMLEDEDFTESVENIIDSQSVNAEYAVASTGDNFAQMFASMDDEYMRGRAADVKDISERLVSVLNGASRQQMDADEPVIVMAVDLAPSETVQMDKDKVLSFVTTQGSVNSHTAILARTMSIPALIGVDMPLDAELEGKFAIVDGDNGTVYIDPSEDVLAQMQEKKEQAEEKKQLLQQLKGKETITKDGKKIKLYANIGNSKDLAMVLQNDAEGIGLFRSEFLYLEKEDYPTENEQFMVYKMVAETMAGKQVIIRTLDIGADKQCDYFNMDPEDNPALGYRAIRICLTRPEVFKTQLRALYRASAFGNISIMYPMITSVWEVKQIKKIVEEVKEELRAQNIEFGEVAQGIMIETPAAVMISRELAKEVDFFSIGTNDLTQYTLAIDRQNPKLDDFYDAHHPAVLEMIRMVAQNAHAEGIWAGICGELGADLELTEQFLQMGIDELSVSPGRILPIRKIVRESECGCE